MCVAIVYFPVCDVVNLDVNFIFLINPFLLYDQNVKAKFKNLENEISF